MDDLEYERMEQVIEQALEVREYRDTVDGRTTNMVSAQTSQIIDEAESFTLKNRSMAAWAMAKLATYRRRIAENDRIAQERIDQINLWRERENRKDERSASYFEALLIDWHHREFAADEKHGKTISLPDGTLKRTPSNGKLEIDDEQFVPWAIDHYPGLLRHEAIKSDVKAAAANITDDGELVLESGEKVPGARIVKDEATFKAIPELGL